MENVAAQLRSIVEDPDTSSQILGAGVANHVAWLVVRLVFLALTLAATPLVLRFVAKVYGERRERALSPGENLVQLGREEDFWRRLTWVAAILLVLSFALTSAREAAEIYKYRAYPRAVVLRDVLGGLRY